MDKKYNSNIWKVYLFSFMRDLALVGGVLVPFLTDWGHITFSQIMILQSWFMICLFLLEIPTGVVADFLGRKTSLAIGAIFSVFAAIVYGSIPNFYFFMIGEFLFAMAAALISGADEALLYDSLKFSKKEKQSKKVLSREESFSKLGILIGSPLGSLIAFYLGLNAPMLIMIIPYFVSFLVMLTVKEPRAKRIPKLKFKNYYKILTEGVHFFYKHRILKILALDMIVIDTIAYFMIWLFQPMLIAVGLSIIYFGIVHSGFALSQIIILNRITYIEKLFGSKIRFIFFSSLITGIMFIVGGITHNLPLTITAIIVGGGFGLARRPVMSSYMNKYIPSKRRATILSCISMLRRVSIAIINPIVGFCVDKSLGYTLLALGIVAVAFSFISGVEESHLKD